MTPEDIIDYCEINNIKLEPTDHGTIIVDVPDKSLWSDDLSQAVKRNKDILIRMLRSQEETEAYRVKNCGNPKCLYQCVYIHNLDRCPWLLDEGTYKWKSREWKRVLH